MTLKKQGPTLSTSLSRFWLDVAFVVNHPGNGGVFDLDNLFRGGDTITGITGVIDDTFGLAFFKAELAAGNGLPTDGMVFISVNDTDKPAGLVVAQRMRQHGLSIAATEGIDGLFVGPADLSVAFGKTDQSSPELMAAFEAVGRATRAAGKAYMTFVRDAAQAAEWQRFGLTVFFIGSEVGWMRAGAAQQARGIHDLAGD